MTNVHKETDKVYVELGINPWLLNSLCICSF